MGTEKNNLGSVMTYIISPTRGVLVKDETKKNPLWKLPGGGIEPGETVVDAAIREVMEETGIQLEQFGEVQFCLEERRDGVYYPHFCIARVSEQKLNRRLKMADENGHPIKTGIFPRRDIPAIEDLVAKHRFFVRAVEDGEFE